MMSSRFPGPFGQVGRLVLSASPCRPHASLRRVWGAKRDARDGGGGAIRLSTQSKGLEFQQLATLGTLGTQIFGFALRVHISEGFGCSITTEE
jgi:hypothetical protein